MNEDWYQLDNVAKVFLADHTNRNPSTLRVSATLEADIDPALLQRALDDTIVMRPQFQVRIRRGFFWHYLEHSSEHPVVVPESGRPCPILYGTGHTGYLHYRVSYFKNRINLDIFHAISDGTGAMNFLKLLLLNYLKLTHPGEFDSVSPEDGSSATERAQNSFDQFYDNSNGPIPKNILTKKAKAFHFQSHKLPYDQLQFFELHLETKALKGKAKELGVSMTSFIGSELMLAISQGIPFKERKKPVTISMPVNLRNYYPSKTLRNFFNNVDVSHVFTGSETLESLSKEYDTNFKKALEPEAINDQMNRYQSIERLFFTRMVPLAIKQPVVRAFSKKDKNRITCVLSNMGVVNLPPEMQKYVTGITDFCSTETFFMTVTSYKDECVLGITTSYSGTGTIRRFINQLQETGTKVTANVSEVIR